MNTTDKAAEALRLAEQLDSLVIIDEVGSNNPLAKESAAMLREYAALLQAQVESKPVAWCDPSWLDPDLRNWPSESFCSHHVDGWIPLYPHPRPAGGGVVHVCPIRDIECGSNPASWCASCPKRPAEAGRVPLTDEQALAAIQRLEVEAQQANEYARQLAIAIHAKYYPEVTQWKPLPDLMGVLTQIDNMTAGLVKPGRLEADNQALKKGEGALDLDAAAKKLAECFDYPWAYMPAEGRAGMRRDALAVILAAMTKEQP